MSTPLHTPPSGLRSVQVGEPAACVRLLVFHPAQETDQALAQRSALLAREVLEQVLLEGHGAGGDQLLALGGRQRLVSAQPRALLRLQQLAEDLGVTGLAAAEELALLAAQELLASPPLRLWPPSRRWNPARPPPAASASGRGR